MEAVGDGSFRNSLEKALTPGSFAMCHHEQRRIIKLVNPYPRSPLLVGHAVPKPKHAIAALVGLQERNDTIERSMFSTKLVELSNKEVQCEVVDVWIVSCQQTFGQTDEKPVKNLLVHCNQRRGHRTQRRHHSTLDNIPAHLPLQRERPFECPTEYLFPHDVFPDLGNIRCRAHEHAELLIQLAKTLVAGFAARYCDEVRWSWLREEVRGGDMIVCQVFSTAAKVTPIDRMLHTKDY